MTADLESRPVFPEPCPKCNATSECVSWELVSWEEAPGDDFVAIVNDVYRCPTHGLFRWAVDETTQRLVVVFEKKNS